jgi:exodeoxyribonuclease-3
VIGIQETKCQDEDFPLTMIEALGYQAHFHGQKSHYGVALLSQQAPLRLNKGYPFDGEDSQRRLITGVYQSSKGAEVTVINGYFPQGESRGHAWKFPAKQKFYADLLRYLQENFDPAQHLVVMGDFNIAPQDLDIGIGDDNAKRWLKSGKCSFLPEEREWIQRLTDWGLSDSFRHLYPDACDRFSWFDYRSRGFEREPRRGLRIDAVLASASLQQHCIAAGIDYDIRAMEKPSDHCPVWAEFDV